MGVQRMILPVAAVLVLVVEVLSAEQVAVAPQEAWSNVFGGREVELHYQISGPDVLHARVGWTLTADQRTLERGEAAVAVAAGRASTTAIKLRLPAVKEGVVLAAGLAVQVLDRRGTALARHDRPLWIFAENPFAGRTQWIRQRKLVLFDPGGETAKRLESAGVPFEHKKRLDAITELKEGLLLIGEGLSVAKHRGLGETMLAAAARGVPVVCLAATEGKLPLPGTEAAPCPMPQQVLLQREEAIVRLDKRLDCRNWPPDGRTQTGGLLIRGEKGDVVATLDRGAKGWPWLEVRYPEPGARLVLCGFGVVEHWDATPAARYLLARLLESADGKTEDSRSMGKEQQ